MLGIALVAAGLVGLVAAFVRFVSEGRGTPAPIAATDELVVGGTYRYVRNPMYVAVVAIIVGQVLIFGSLGLLAYAVPHLVDDGGIRSLVRGTGAARAIRRLV